MRDWPAAVRYSAAPVFVGAALLLTLSLGDKLEHALFVFFWPAVIGAAAFGGLGPALVASLLAVVAADWFLIDPTATFNLPRNLVPFVAFVGTSSLVSVITTRMRSARRTALAASESQAMIARDLREQTDRVQNQAIELEQQLEEMQSLSEELEASNEELALRTAEAERGEQYTRSILEAISDPFVVMDAQWRYRFINTGASEVLKQSGRDPATMIGQVVWEAYPEMVGTEVERAMRRAAEERKPITSEVFVPESGEWSHISSYPLPDGGIATMWRDITERKRAEESAHYLARASAVLSASLDYDHTLRELANVLVPDLADWAAVDLVDEHLVRTQVAVAHVNPQKVEFVRQLNEKYPPEDRRDRGVLKVVLTGKPDLIPEIPRQLLEDAAQDAEHLRLIQELDLRSAIVAPLSVGDRTIGALTLVSAESRRRYTEDDLDLVMELARRAALAVEHARLHARAIEAQRAAEDANRAKMQFLTVMSHELRTPLNAIAGYVDLMSMGIRGPITDEQESDLERITRSQRHLLSLINDVLNYAKLESARVDYDLEPVPVASLLDDVEPLVRPQLRGKSLDLRVGEIADSVAVRADREKLRQVLLNLLSNAVKFTPNGGTITISCVESGDQLGIEVADTGIGIEVDKIDEAFEPFVQIGRELHTPQSGTGLGLSISRDLVRGMGGEIVARSVPGKGSVFTIRLPRA